VTPGNSGTMEGAVAAVVDAEECAVAKALGGWELCIGPLRISRQLSIAANPALLF
jgi:hypothetical protein